MCTSSECEQTVFFIVQYPFEPTIEGWLFFMYRMYSIAQGARDGGARMLRDERTGNRSRHYLHFHHPWRSYSARSQGWQCAYVQDVKVESSCSENAWLYLQVECSEFPPIVLVVSSTCDNFARNTQV